MHHTNRFSAAFLMSQLLITGRIIPTPLNPIQAQPLP